MRLLPKIAKKVSLACLPDLLAGRLGRAKGSRAVPLRTIVAMARNGKTPGRAHYAAAGLFLVKVGNLTGQGINWTARARNFIANPEADMRRQNASLMLRPGDILLTSSAHSPVYIAKKVDIVSAVPAWVGGQASFVG